MKTVGVALIDMLEALGTEFVFGIPGVHTVELYRGLAESPIRHITPRHEQGAGFMADGYARASGKPGVCFLITGPGLTNGITAMAQAMQDSIPMLVITGVNPVESMGKGRGLLHELPDQHGLIKALTPHAYSLRRAEDLPGVLARAYQVFASERPGPVHIEIPIDLMSAPMPDYQMPAQPQACTTVPDLTQALSRMRTAKAPIILAGGGCRAAGADVMALARVMDAPVISTANARTHLGNDPLHVSGSASIPALREQIAQADLVIALGTEMGPTDYDVFVDGGFPVLQQLIRLDIDPERLTQEPTSDIALQGDVAVVVPALTQVLTGQGPSAAQPGTERARAMMQAVQPPTGSVMEADLDVIDAIIETLPGCIIVGDSTQLVYSGNMLLRGSLPGGWFNSATGYGTLGYAPPAAVGAALACPDQPVVCLVGDGGLQFSAPELGSAVDAGASVIFLVWNNSGYKEIENYMRANDITPVGVTPTPAQSDALAQAFGLQSLRAENLSELTAHLNTAHQAGGCWLIEAVAPVDRGHAPWQA